MAKLKHIMGTTPKVYCDLDGVLADFDSYVEKILGSRPQQMPDSELWKSIIPFIREDKFWIRFSKMKDADQLWKYIKKYDVEVLSASGTSLSDVSAKAKREWVKRRFGHVKTNVVRTASGKIDFVGDGVVLIDDRKRTIDKWNAAGGIGILHTSASDTIKQLKAIGL